MAEYKFKLEVRISPSAFVPTEFVENEMRSALKYTNLIDERNFPLNPGEGVVEVKSNLSSMLHVKNSSRDRELYNEIKKGNLSAETVKVRLESILADSDHNPNNRKIVDFSISFPENSEKARSASKRFASQYIERYISDVSLLLNLSAPGCFSFYPERIFDNEDFDNPLIDGVTLDAFLFDNAWNMATGRGWPRVEAIPLARVIKWYDSLNVQRYIAGTRLQRAIFALLHVTNSKFAG